MPLTLPDLDDRSYADLLAEARALIPALAPDWTDHNPADPGITLIELFAWLTEMLLYRVNQVTDNNQLAFLRLINGPDWSRETDGDGRPKKTVAEEVRKTVLALRQPARAITATDFERLALEVAGVARAHCVARYNLEERNRESRRDNRPADVSVVVVSKQEGNAADLLTRVREALEPARLLTTRLHVVSARRVAIGINLTVRDRARMDWRRDAPRAPTMLALTIHGRPDMPGELLLQAAEHGLRGFLEPDRDRPGESGWRFGRAVYLSEIYERLAQLPGADYVTPTGSANELDANEKWRLLHKTAGELEGVDLDPDELPAAAISTGQVIAVPARR
jgi:hypothetical protein